jgi:hypothetical protein
VLGASVRESERATIAFLAKFVGTKAILALFLLFLLDLDYLFEPGFEHPAPLTSSAPSAQDG